MNYHRSSVGESKTKLKLNLKTLLSGAISLLALELCVSCRTAPPLPAADFSAPGWRVMQGQAVWKPARDRAELAGDLLLATNSDGDVFVQLTKTPFPLASAEVAGDRWQIAFGANEYSWRGRGQPPSRFVCGICSWI